MTAVSIAASKEWYYTVEYFKVAEEEMSYSPFGQYFTREIGGKSVLIYFAGRGRKVAGSAAAQYFIDRHGVTRVIVAGTAAGIDESNEVIDIVIPYKAVQCDTTVREMESLIRERFTVDLELPKLPFDFKTGVIGTQDKPIVMWNDHVTLRDNGITIADTEAAAIAFVCKLNNVECVIAKGISDFALEEDKTGAERSYIEQYETFVSNVPKVMKKIFDEYLEYLV